MRIKAETIPAPKALIVRAGSYCMLALLFLWALTGAASAINDPESRIAKVIRAHIAARYPSWSGEEIRLTFKFADKDFSRIAKFPEEAKVSILQTYADFKPVGNVIFPIEVSSNGNDYKFFLRTNVAVIRPVVAAARNVKKGKLLEAADFKIERRDVAMMPEKYYVEYSTMLGKESKLSIPSGSTVFEWMVGDLPLIRKGSEVTIVVTGDGLEVKAKGTAQEDGYQGGEIKVKTKDSKTVVSGKVVSADEVELTI